MPGLMIFNATRRRTGSSCSAMINHPAATFANLRQQLVTSDKAARLLIGLNPASDPLHDPLHRRMFQEVSDAIMNFQQRLDLLAKIAVTRAHSIQVSGAFLDWQAQRFRENFHVSTGRIAHKITRVLY